MRVNIKSKRYDEKKATNRAYGIRRKQREANVFLSRIEAQRHDHRLAA